MAGVIERLRKKPKQNSSDWSRTGTFVNKPTKGWLHPDEQLSPDAGICYGVRYIGCMEVKVSMRSLDFDTRTAVAKESISRVCDAAGLKTATKKKKERKIARLLADQPNMQYAGANVNLTVNTESLMLMIMESGEVIANHHMPGISFASGGDPDTMDFVAYVAKDAINGRACHVLECGGGLAQDVITTVGQAFELRFKEYIKNQPKAVNLPDRLEDPIFNRDESAWGEDPEYYNDRPGAQPPSPTQMKKPPVPPLPQYSAPTSNLQVSDGIYSSIPSKQHVTDMPNNGQIYDNGLREVPVDNLIDLSGGCVYDNPKARLSVVGDISLPENGFMPDSAKGVYDNPDEASNGYHRERRDSMEKPPIDAFNMQPFSKTVVPPKMAGKQSPPSSRSVSITPDNEEWFHGALNRKQAEALLKNNGDFLVRESSNSPGQYVLSGVKAGHVKHLLLVDPQGIVRTKDRTFDSVSHLISHHLTNNAPIMSQDSELLLVTPIVSQC